MFTRRVILLFVLFTLGFAVLAMRLGNFQLAQADDWSRQATRFVQRHYLIDTHRGTIFDVQGRPVARDEPSDDIVLDFQAMNLDDEWITRTARQRLTAMGVTKREDRLRQLPEVKDQIVAQVEAIPETIVHLYDVARAQPGGEAIPPLKAEEIQERYNVARKRISLLKQDQWLRRYNKDETPDDLDADNPDDEPIKPVAEEMQAHTIVEDVPLAVKIAVHNMHESLPGVDVVASKRRKYAYGDVAAQVIGVTQAVDEKQVARAPFSRPDLLTGEPGNLSGYLPADRIGTLGIEDFCESTLRGSRGVGLRELGGADIPDKHINSEPGKDVQLTLDMELQKSIQGALYENNHLLLKGQFPEKDNNRDHSVALVILRIEDRAVLTMISTPTFDLNDYQKNIVALNADVAHKPILNRVIHDTYPPGSTVKPFVAAAALTEGSLKSPEVIVVCRGYLYPNMKDAWRCDNLNGHGPLNMIQALERSCNIYFYTQARDLGLPLMTKWYGLFGFGTRTGIGPGESDGNIPDVASFHNEETMRNEATQNGIGQGSLNATPLQLANAYCTLLAGGIWRSPTLIATENKPARRVFDIDPDNLAAIKEGMHQVVHGSAGTAHSLFAGFNLDVSGKTGSATTELRPVFDDDGKPVYRQQLDADGEPVLGPDGKPALAYKRGRDGKLMFDQAGNPMPIQETVSDTDSWFVGCAPANDPKYVIVALKEFGGHGGITAAPLVRRAFVQMEKQGYLPNVDAR